MGDGRWQSEVPLHPLTNKAAVSLFIKLSLDRFKFLTRFQSPPRADSEAPPVV